MNKKNSNPAIRPAFIVAMLLVSAMVIGLQFLYTAGQVYHVVMMVYKAGEFVPHLISFGKLGVLLYLIVAMIVTIGLLAFIKYRGGASNAKMAILLLVFSLVSTIAFFALIIMPYSDVVFRS